MRIMGILNVTPDSFSDGGMFLSADAALRQADLLIESGADIIDIGGESSRPGAGPVGLEVEWRQIGPVLERVCRRYPVSVDTTKAEIARRALELGAGVVNDISAGRGSEDMFSVCAKAKATLIVMHMRGEPRTMQQNLMAYDNVVNEVRAFLLQRVTAAKAAGINDVWVDPGLGFGKSEDDNWRLLAELSSFADLGSELVIGCSRKRFLKSLATGPDSQVELDYLSAQVNLHAAVCGATVFRVHAPKVTKNALSIAKKLIFGRSAQPCAGPSR